MAVPFSVARQGHYRVHAYICGQGCLKFPDVEGTLTFEGIYTKRPDGCRYVVVGLHSVVSHAEDILVFDLYAVKSYGRTRRFETPPPIGHYCDVDQAIMATMLRYEDEI